LGTASCGRRLIKLASLCSSLATRPASWLSFGLGFLTPAQAYEQMAGAA
jgi:hypothetical protein